MAGKLAPLATTNTRSSFAPVQSTWRGLNFTSSEQSANTASLLDEPRRSGRATKGQHTKNLEDDPPPSKKQQKGKKGKKAESNEPEEEEEEDDALIRCVCGDKEEVEGLSENPKMICCDKCEAWQHNVCMGITEDDNKLPEQYFCEQCRSENHQELLAAIARGERPWEARLQALIDRVKQKKSKKGRKSKGGRASAIGTESEPATTPKPSAVASPAPQQTPAQRRKTAQVEVPARVSAKKPTFLKHAANLPPLQVSPATPQPPATPATPAAAPEPKAQRRKSTHLAEENPLKRRQSTKLDENALKRRKSSLAGLDEPVDSIDKLPADRKKAAQPLYKKLKEWIDASVKSSAYSHPPNHTNESRAVQLALGIEYGLYCRFPRPEENYQKNDQLRTIIFNLGKNPVLLGDVLADALSTDDLAWMTSEEMASEELQKERERIKEEVDKQAIIYHEEGPRIRKTHKGDELIGGDDMNRQPEPAYNAAARAPSAGSPIVAQSPTGFARSPTTAGAENGAQPLSVNTAVDHSYPDRKPSANFDIQSVWSKVRSPEVTQGAFPLKPVRTFSMSQQQQQEGQGPGEDADIDRLLKDDEMEGVSPTAGVSAEWRGNLYMRKQNSTLAIRGTAHYVAGCDAAFYIPWAELLPGDMEINGRIAMEVADDYLCGYRYSATKELSLLKFVPDPRTSPDEENGGTDPFAQIFSYFTAHNRWGVSKYVNQHTALKDLYVVPVKAGDSMPPKFMAMLENAHLDSTRTEDVIYFVLIVQVRDTPTGERPPATPSLSTPQSAVAPNDPFAASTGPPPPVDGSSQAAPQTPVPGPTPDPSFNPPPLAVQILGDFIHTPVARSVVSLPNITQEQLENLRHAFETDPLTRNDLNYLSQFLSAKQTQTAGREAGMAH
jgi:Transcription factor S-II (TFIIS), central domain/SPOC domain/PHD-finger